MGLPAGLKKMLQVSATHYVYTGKDTFGNDQFAATPASILVFVDETNGTYGRRMNENSQQPTPAEQTTVYVDGITVKVLDRINYGTGRRKVSATTDYRGRKGESLFQTIVTETE